MADRLNLQTSQPRHKSLEAKATDMSFDILPAEIILEIAERLDSESDINAFAQVNRKLHSVINLHLYRFNALHSFRPALGWAVERGEVETAKYALECGAKINGRVRGTMRLALELAVIHGQEKMAAFLLERGANPNERIFRDTMLHRAVAFGNKAVMKACLEGGADINRKDSEGDPPMKIAVTRMCPILGGPGDLDILEFLLMKGGDPNVPGKLGATPLHVAVSVDWEAAAAILLEYGADINRRDDFHKTPLDEAKSWDSERMVEFLLENGATTGQNDMGL